MYTYVRFPWSCMASCDTLIIIVPVSHLWLKSASTCSSRVLSQHSDCRLRDIDVWKVYKSRMWSTITSPTNSTKKLIVVQKHAKLIEPQLITVDCNETHHANGGGAGDDLLFYRQPSSGLRRFRPAQKELPAQENHRGYHVTTTLSKGGCGPAKVVLTQRSVDNKTPVTSA